MAPAGAQQSALLTEAAPPRTHNREAGEWAELLAELATLLGNGQFHNSRDLPVIEEPLGRVVDRYIRRREA